MPVKVGDVFGRLTVLSFAGAIKKNSVWTCRCECGIEKNIRHTNLISNQSRSCGCLRKETHFRKHGHAGKGGLRSPEYRAWQGIHTRCSNSKDKAFHNYGGRGISVCSRWSGENGFTNFLLDMGPRPSQEYSLDRIDNNGNYEPSNCKWSTAREQVKNRRPLKAIENMSMEALLTELWRRTPEYGMTAC